jgi:hypothetical protein
LIIDTYIESIIQSTPSDVTDVLLCESTASWKLGEKQPTKDTGDDGGGENDVYTSEVKGYDSDVTEEEEIDFFIDTHGTRNTGNKSDEIILVLDDEDGGPVSKRSRSTDNRIVANSVDIIELD